MRTIIVRKEPKFGKFMVMVDGQVYLIDENNIDELMESIAIFKLRTMYG